MKAIVTGHTRGLGAAIAAELLSRNIAVLGLSRGGNRELKARFPDALEEVGFDLSDSAAVQAWLAGGAMRTFLAGDKFVVLVNNAGTVQPVAPLAAQDPSDIARSVALNVATPLMLAAAFAAASSDAGDRRILHISSGAARNAYPSWSVYCATKAALDRHAQAVALDKLPGLRICSLAPGVVDTDMQAELRATTPEQFPLRDRFESLKQSGQLLSPEDCARRVVDHLLSARFGDAPVADVRELGQ